MNRIDRNTDQPGNAPRIDKMNPIIIVTAKSLLHIRNERADCVRRAMRLRRAGNRDAAEEFMERASECTRTYDGLLRYAGRVLESEVRKHPEWYC